MNRFRSSNRVGSILIASLLLCGEILAQAGPQLPNPGNPSVSREQQIQVGFQAASEVYKQMPVLPDNSPETRYVRQVGQRLAAAIPQQYSWPFEFHTIAEKDINAFALPGGPMFVNLGAITAAGSEAELAGVMAHEMAHVYMQHSAKMMRQNTGPSIVAGLGQILGSMIGGIGGAAASIGGQMAGGMWSMKFSRGDESQADAVGAMIMYRAGYDPRALARFFERLEQEGGSRGPQFLSDHPNPGNRQEAILNESDKWPPKQWRTNSAAFTQAQQAARQAKTYTAEEIAAGAKSGRWADLNRKNGAVFKAPPGVNVQQTSAGQQQGGPQGSPQASGPVSWRDVAPSSQMVKENFGPINIARPENWEVFSPQQQGQSITIAPRAGLAGNGIGVGAVINGVMPQNGSGDIDQTTSDILRSLESGNGDMQVTGNPEPVTVNGVHGRSVMLEGSSPFPGSNGQPQRERDWLVTLPQQDGSVVFVVFVSPQSEYERLKPTFETMLRSLHLGS
jgi:beta-barrel assembly-enhancing protease